MADTDRLISSVFGNYRIKSSTTEVIFPVPTTNWQEQPISAGLNGIPFISSYRTHVWNWSQLEPFWANKLFELFKEQQSNNSQLTTLETDEYDAGQALESYGTVEYMDFVILDISNRTRGLPNYDDLSVTFEVYVA